MDNGLSHDAYLIQHILDVDRDLLVDRGLCRTQDPTRFFPVDETAFTNTGSRQPNRTDRRWDDARAICHQCPVRIPCLAYAVNNPGAAIAGVWGGRDLPERQTIRKHLGTPASMLS